MLNFLILSLFLIPSLYDPKITLIDERLYGIIYWFTKLKNEKCTASNITLAKLVKTSPGTIKNSLTKLEEQKYIKRVMDEGFHRKEIIAAGGVCKN